MAEHRATQDVVALTRAFGRVAGDVDGEMAFYGPTPVYDLSPMGIGVYEGRAAIRAFLTGWMTSYEGYEEDMQEVIDVGHGIAFAAVRESALPLGSNAQARVHSVYGFAIAWVDGKIARITAYPDAEEARRAAERIATERDR
jgi:ketosteroid isomerase-like protein